MIDGDVADAMAAQEFLEIPAAAHDKDCVSKRCLGTGKIDHCTNIAIRLPYVVQDMYDAK